MMRPVGARRRPRASSISDSTTAMWSLPNCRTFGVTPGMSIGGKNTGLRSARRRRIEERRLNWPQIRFALSRDSAVSGLFPGDITRGDALADLRFAPGYHRVPCQGAQSEPRGLGYN